MNATGSLLYNVLLLSFVMISFIHTVHCNMEKLIQLPQVIKQVREKRMGWNFFPCPERSNWIPTEDVSYPKIPIRLNLLHYFPFLLFLIWWMVLINLIKRQTVNLEMSYIASVWTISKNKVRFFRTQTIKLSNIPINKPHFFYHPGSCDLRKLNLLQNNTHEQQLCSEW